MEPFDRETSMVPSFAFVALRAEEDGELQANTRDGGVANEWLV